MLKPARFLALSGPSAEKNGFAGPSSEDWLQCTGRLVHGLRISWRHVEVELITSGVPAIFSSWRVACWVISLYECLPQKGGGCSRRLLFLIFCFSSLNQSRHSEWLSELRVCADGSLEGDAKTPGLTGYLVQCICSLPASGLN